MGLELYFVVCMLIFIGFCAAISWRRGYEAGLVFGAESCLDLLEKEGILEIQIGEGGQEYVAPVQFEKDEKDTN